MAYLVAGPFVALVGIFAVFFVLRRKSVDKRSMYAARRQQFEHKVRAARQRTLTPRGHAPKPAEPEATSAAVSPFAQTQVQPTVTYEAPAYEPPPAAPPPPPAFTPPQEATGPAPWDLPAAAAAAPSTFDYPAAPPEPAFPPAQPDTFQPAPATAPGEPVWTPAPEPAGTAAHVDSIAPAAASAAAAAAWSVVSPAKEPEPEHAQEKGKGKKKKDQDSTGSWELASGDEPGNEADEPLVRRPSGTTLAIAQYAILVVGLVMVLIGVLVMVANSHVT